MKTARSMFVMHRGVANMAIAAVGICKLSNISSLERSRKFRQQHKASSPYVNNF